MGKEEVTLAEARCGDANNCQRGWTNGGIGMFRIFPGITTNGYKGDGSYSHIRASFALDLGIVPPLFVVATKCRDRKLRREAIALLMSSPRREGMWDSLLCGKVGEWIMEVEEEGMRDFDTWDPVSASEKVPEDKRVMVKEILFDLQRRLHFGAAPEVPGTTMWIRERERRILAGDSHLSPIASRDERLIWNHETERNFADLMALSIAKGLGLGTWEEWASIRSTAKCTISW